MGSFELNGGTFGSLLDPAVQYNGQDLYGRQLNQLVIGEQSDWTLSWGQMSDIAFTELVGRINSAAGARVDIKLPYTSVVAWTSMYAHVRLASFRRAGALVLDVVLEVIGASTTL